MFSIFVIARTERCVLPWVNGICTSKRKVVVAMPLGAADKKATTSGIYLTADDSLNGKLTSEGERDSSSHNSNLHDSFFGKPYAR